MGPADFLRILHARPFQPFRVVLLDGMTYEVRHPELVVVMPTSALIGYPSQTLQGMAENADIIGLGAIARVEFLTQPSPSVQGNGNPS